MKTLRLEFYKIKRRKVWLTVFAMLLFQFLWGVWTLRAPKEWELESGWMRQLYDLSVLNGMMMPTTMALLASRLSDIEHKGDTYKLLKTMRSAGHFYHAKALCGVVIVTALVAAQFAAFTLYGFSLGYKGVPETGYYLAAFALQLSSCLSLFFLQLLLSMLFANQMIALVAGLGGSMAALLLMFVSRHSFLPWGGILSASLVGMDWDERTRIMTYYYREFSLAEKASIACIFVWMAVFYGTGRALFSRREE